MQHVLLLAAAGALGTLARYGLSSLIGILIPASFPWGIFITNILGCMLFGSVWALCAVHHVLEDTTRIIILTGFMGSFTTFSTLIFDTHALLSAGQTAACLLNLFGQIVLGLIGLWLGIQLTTKLIALI